MANIGLGKPKMNIEERMAAALLAGLNDPRVNILCIRKPDGRFALQAMQEIVNNMTDFRFEYWSLLDAEKQRQEQISQLVTSIQIATDGRSIRGLLSTLFEVGKDRGLIPKGIARNGFFYYIRSLSPLNLRRFIESSGVHGGVRIGPLRTIGEGAQRVLFYDNIGNLVAKDGVEAWISRRFVTNSRNSYKMMVIAGDCDFPKEIVGLGNWGYSIDLVKEIGEGEIEKFSPVELSWDRNTLAAESRTGEQEFKAPIEKETLVKAYAALSAVSINIMNRIPQEQIDQRIIQSFSYYNIELEKNNPNPILLDCCFDLFMAQVKVEEGVSTILKSMLDALSRRHKAAVSSSEICRDLDRAARFISPSESLPERLLDELVSDLVLAEREQVVDKSVRVAAGELVDLEKEPQQGARKKRLAFGGFVKAMWTAFKNAPDAVKGIDAFNRLLLIADKLKEFIFEHIDSAH